MSVLNTDVYSHSEHIFRFAAWSASTAASAYKKCRFSVKIGSKILLDSDLYDYTKGFKILPKAEQFDELHKKLCYKIIYASKKSLPEERYKHFSYGIAAKLLNCYFKSIYLMQFHSALDENIKSKISVIHPPIDRVLLMSLSKNNNEKIKSRDKFWKKMALRGWSKFQEDEYKAVINKIKEVQKEKNEPLWMIEESWQGFQ